jgi:hypothetical protein
VKKIKMALAEMKNKLKKMALFCRNLYLFMQINRKLRKETNFSYDLPGFKPRRMVKKRKYRFGQKISMN